MLILAALAGMLAGCQRGGASAASPATGGTPTGVGSSATAGSPTASATSSTTPCPEAEATKTYVRATSAHVEGNSVVVSGHPTQRVCGGPNNSHFEIGTATEHLRLPPSASVVLLTTTPSGIGHETVPPADFPKRLVDDRFGRIFLVRGPLGAVTSLEEQYHP